MRRMPHHRYASLLATCFAALRSAVLVCIVDEKTEGLRSCWKYLRSFLETFGLTGPSVQFREALLLTDPAGLRKTFQVFLPLQGTQKSERLLSVP